MNDDHELISDFVDEYTDAQYEIENVLKLWDLSDYNASSVNTLFRAVHSIKSNLFMMRLNNIADAIHKLEDLLSQIRDKKREITPGFSLLISMTLEQCKIISKHELSGTKKSVEIDKVTNVFLNLCQSNHNQFEKELIQALTIIDDIGEYGNDYSSQPLIDFLQQEESQLNLQETSPSLIDDKKIIAQKDLEFFLKLITQVESYFPFWKNRSARIIEIVTRMNEYFEHMVDQEQLQAAVYMHDIGMSFIPPQKIYISKTLKTEDRQLMHSHAELGFQWLSRVRGWESAATMVLQHHEHFDGNGYPYGLQADQICLGAKFIAIADTYTSITNQDKKGGKSQPLIFAKSEINQGSGHQFDPECVEVFSQVIQELKI